MNKNQVSAIFLGMMLLAPTVAGAAYPVYQNYYAGQNAVVMPAQTQMAQYQRPMVTVPTVGNGVMVVNSGVAAQPNRITGALPRVGSAATAAGRQYYMPADYDRLADSGLYIGLSVGYAASVMGSMHADYAGETDAYIVPGAFAPAGFNHDTVLPLQLSVGAAINNNLRVDFSYARYSGMGYPGNVTTASDSTGTANVQAAVEGGAVTSSATMLNLYYNIDSYTGYLAGGALRPYIGLGVGLSLNTISDYVVHDDTYYEVVSDLSETINNAGVLTGISDIFAYHNGGTAEQLAFMLEGGVTTDLGDGLKLDFFVRYANLGNVKTSGSIVLSQTEWLSDGYGSEVQADYDSVFHYTNWYESGRLSLIDVGIRLRLQF